MLTTGGATKILFNFLKELYGSEQDDYFDYKMDKNETSFIEPKEISGRT